MDQVKDILNKKGYDIWMVKSDDSIRTALTLMNEKKIGAVLVRNAKGQIEGIFSERDFARACSMNNTLSLDIPIKDYMSKRVICVNPQQTIENCLALMTEKRIRHLPVVDDEKPVGLISIGDVVKAFIWEKDFLIDQLESYISGSL